MYWSYDKSNNYGLLNPDGSEKAILLGALVRPYPERVAGNPISYAFDRATSTFTFAYAPDRTITLPTEIAVPERSYPNGYQVDCGGCTYEKRPGALVVSTPPAGASASVVLLPIE